MSRLDTLSVIVTSTCLSWGFHGDEPTFFAVVQWDVDTHSSLCERMHIHFSVEYAL